jgi:hypothetical protein
MRIFRKRYRLEDGGHIGICRSVGRWRKKRGHTTFPESFQTLPANVAGTRAILLTGERTGSSAVSMFLPRKHLRRRDLRQANIKISERTHR